MEALQLLQVSPVQGPCLTTIEKADENDRPVHLELRGLPDAVLAQDASLQSAKMSCTMWCLGTVQILSLSEFK